jgi:hypothetical protein
MPKCIGDDVAADIGGEAVKVAVNRGCVLPTGVLYRERFNVEGIVRRRMTFERDGLNELDAFCFGRAKSGVAELFCTKPPFEAKLDDPACLKVISLALFEEGSDERVTLIWNKHRVPDRPMRWKG